MAGAIQVTVVTPEKAVLDTQVDFVVLPLFDGEVGIGKGHAPFVGQLGPGEFRTKLAGEVTRYFIDGGFAQVRNNVVTVLTAKATLATDITVAESDTQRAAAEALPVATPTERTTREKALVRAMALKRVAVKN